MERSFSVDDLVGGIWRLGQAGMGRTDSEAAFQEFLKRIPSATNLAGGAGQNVDPAQLEAHLQQHAQQLQQQAQQALHQTGNAAPVSSGPASSAPESSTSGGGDAPPGPRNGIPRVPSLDLLRQLVMNQQLSLGQSAVKTEPQSNPAPAAAASGAPLVPGARAMPAHTVPGPPSPPNPTQRAHMLCLLMHPHDMQHACTQRTPCKHTVPLRKLIRKHTSPHLAPPAHTPAGFPLNLPTDLAALTSSAGLTAALQAALPQPQSHLVQNPLAAAAAAAAALNPAAAVALQQQLGQLAGFRLGAAVADKESMEKQEIRRARR
jgi:hypothetical protein